MNSIKLDATTSTNTFLKSLAASQVVENFTTVVAEKQTEGKGQRGSVWSSEGGKNLMASVFYSDFDFRKHNPFVLNALISVSVLEVLQNYNLKQLAIKWPNDILAENKKIAGILIENLFKKADQIQTIIGIGMNVNQKYFENLPKASSIFNLTGNETDREELLERIVNQIRQNFIELDKNGEEYFWEVYHKYLFRKNIPTVFMNKEGNSFQAMVKKVNKEGKLCLEMESGEQKAFEVKEIQFCY